MSLTFEAAPHVYKWENKVVPSVTQVLQAMGCYKGENYYNEKSRLLGNYVHQTCELFDTGELDEKHLDTFLKGFLDSWKRFKDFMKAEIILNEQPMYSQIRGYSGTVDRLVKTEKAGNILIDFKTGSKDPAHWLQLGGYAWLLLEHGYGKDGSFTSGTLYLQEDGSMPIWNSIPDQRIAMNDFFSMLGAYQWKKSNGFL